MENNQDNIQTSRDGEITYESVLAKYNAKNAAVTQLENAISNVRNRLDVLKSEFNWEQAQDSMKNQIFSCFEAHPDILNEDTITYLCGDPPEESRESNNVIDKDEKLPILKTLQHSSDGIEQINGSSREVPSSEDISILTQNILDLESRLDSVLKSHTNLMQELTELHEQFRDKWEKPTDPPGDYLGVDVGRSENIRHYRVDVIYSKDDGRTDLKKLANQDIEYEGVSESYYFYPMGFWNKEYDDDKLGIRERLQYCLIAADWINELIEAYNLKQQTDTGVEKTLNAYPTDSDDVLTKLQNDMKNIQKQ